MIDPNEKDLQWSIFGIGIVRKVESEWINRPLITRINQSFTRSNGTIMARIYEGLTKRSRRRDATYEDMESIVEFAYRRGVYEAFSALQKELE